MMSKVSLKKHVMNYIYELFETIYSTTPFYVGYTHRPDKRLTEHKQVFGKDIVMGIVKAVKGDPVKTEQEWIKTVNKWGIKLKNKNRGGGGVKKGHKRTEEFKLKISKANKGNKRDVTPATLAKQKPVIQYDLNGKIVGEYESAKIAAKEIGLHPNNMYDHLKGMYHTARGHIFKYK
jgi:hypothetical protein